MEHLKYEIEQTEREPIQMIEPEELTDAVKDFDMFMQAITDISPVPTRFDGIEGGAKGYYDSANISYL